MWVCLNIRYLQCRKWTSFPPFVSGHFEVLPHFQADHGSLNVRLLVMLVMFIGMFNDIGTVVICYSCSSVNIAFGFSRSELTKPGEIIAIISSSKPFSCLFYPVIKRNDLRLPYLKNAKKNTKQMGVLVKLGRVVTVKLGGQDIGQIWSEFAKYSASQNLYPLVN